MHRPASGFARSVVLVMLCGLALLLGSGQALAHTRLRGSEPTDGARLPTAPERVSLQFNEMMEADFATMTVTGPDGGPWHTGEVTADGTTVSIALRPLGPAGRYEIGYRVVSDDGHPVTGSVAFVLTAEGPGVPVAPEASVPAAAPDAATPAADAPPPSSEQGTGTLVWPWLVGAVLLVAGGVAAALRLGRT